LQLTLWSLAIRDGPPVVKPLDNFPALYGIRRFVTLFTTLVICPYPEPDQSSPYHSILALQDPS
jgi:hypothetical protein